VSNRRRFAVLVLAACALSLDAQGVSGDRALRALVGTLSGATAYTAFMAMGLAADSYAGRVYAADKAVGIVSALRSLARVAAEGLDALLDTDALYESDRAYVRGMLAAYGHLVAEADGFETWVRTGERASFDRARRLAWQAIVDTLAQESAGDESVMTEPEALE
jgi:hypothetical protein